MSVALALLSLGLAVSPARAASGQDLSGEWLNSAYTLSSYQLHMSADRKTLTASWGTDTGSIQGGLVGSFTGTLNQSGTAFVGRMHVTAGSLRIGGTMTVAISSQQQFGYPLLTVSYQQDNGVAGSLTLEIWLLPPTVSPRSSRAVTFAFDCPGPQSCQDEAEARAVGVGRSANVGSVRFTVNPGGTRMIKLSLDQTGQTLLAEHHGLRVQVLVVAVKKSSTLPAQTMLGTVAFQIK
jgi:hypothetical protein